MPACSRKPRDALGPGQVEHLVVHGQQHPGQRGAEGGGRRHQRHAAAPADAVRTDGPGADPVGQRPDRPVPATGDVLPDRLGTARRRGLPAHHGVHPDQSAFCPAFAGAGTASVARGRLERRRHPRHRHRQPDRRHGERVPGQRRRHLPAPKNYAIGQRVWRVTVADVNNDGRPDILTANKGDNTSASCWATATARSSPRSSFPSGTRPAAWRWRTSTATASPT